VGRDAAADPPSLRPAELTAAVPASPTRLKPRGPIMTIEEYRAFVDRLPKAAHEMEHITNLGKIIAGGFILIASEIRRSHDPVDQQAIAAKLAAEREAKRERLRRELADLGDDPAKVPSAA